MCKVRNLRTLVTQRLNVVVEELFELFERTIADYEEELCRVKDENKRQRQLLNAVHTPHAVSHETEENKEEKEVFPSQQQEELAESPHIKEEKVLSSQNGLKENDVAAFTLTNVHLKSEEDEGQSSQLPHCESEKLDQHISTEEHFGGLHAQSEKLVPLSDMDNKMSHSPDFDHNDQPKEPLKTKINSKSDHADNKCSSCSECGKTFVHKGALNRHLRTHSGEKPFSCAVCAKGFSLKANLKRHTSIHHEAPRGGTTRRSAGVQFGCPDCGKTFGQKCNLITHMRTHTGEKPFACSYCDRTFHTKLHVKRHTAIHTGERPFSCSYCGKSFRDKYDMINHTRMHTGEKPFTCSMCAKGFSRSSYLRIHMRNHAEEKDPG